MRFQAKITVLLLALTAAPLLPALAVAQDHPPSGQSLQGPGDCGGSNRAQPATNPARESRDGTAPGNAGSTGWTGGTGGSHIGTNTNGALPSSPTWQPPTARGLDPIAARPRAAC
ncbi:hypothetical protein [Roseomonas elaeocarpi]|uniref:Uncharacterized protein n=1 Tax=Roseomonas elaeocarpi TaxID=907779 RepID=A0ABV6JVC9_9PROT